MIDRVPINVLANGAIKHNVYDAAGNLLRTEYVKRDDGATVTGTPFDKAHILADAVKALLWPSGSVPTDPSINDVFSRLSGGLLYDNGAIKNLLGQLVTLPVSQLDNPVHIATGSYTGTGTYGSANPCSLTFNFPPKLVVIHDGENGYSVREAKAFFQPGQTLYAAGCTGVDYTDGNGHCAINGNTLTWHNSSSANAQLNTSGVTFRFAVLG